MENINPNMPPLSSEAKTLLKEASQDRSGAINRKQFLNNESVVQTNGKNFIADKNPRTFAIWSGAVDELEKFGLIEAKGHKRELFDVTRNGYALADSIKL